MSNKYQSPKELAESSGWPERRIRNLVNERKLRHVKVGRRIFIPKGSIQEYMECNTIAPIKDDDTIEQQA